MRLVKLDPDTAYINDMLWLPRRRINEGALKLALQYYTQKGGGMVIERLWDSTDSHLIVPREFYSPESYPDFGFSFVDLNPRSFPTTNISDRITLDADRGQVDAYDALSSARTGILNLAPGKGKTVLACKLIGERRTPTLIVVHNTYLMEQWKERIEHFLEMPVKEKLGIIQGKKFDWERPVTLAMINTLALRAKEGDIPPEFSFYFGQVFYDEVHHLSAPLFAQTAPLVRGSRYGLSATPERNDGLHYIYQYHLGPVFYSDMTPGLGLDIYIQETPSYIDLTLPEVTDVTGEVHLGKLCNAIADLPDVIDFRERCIREAVDAGRKVLCISRGKSMLVKLAERFDNAALIVEETPQAERTGLVKRSQVIFAISQLGLEGLDDDGIDSAVVLTPLKDQLGLIQFFGRLQRPKTGKKTPTVVFMDDVRIPILHALINKARKEMRNRGYNYRTLSVP